MIEEIIQVKKRTAQELFDCAMDPMIRDKLSRIMAPARLDNLKRASSRGGSFHRRHNGPVPAKDRDNLLANQLFHSYDVVMVTDEIQAQLKHLERDRKQTFELYTENEQIKELMQEEYFQHMQKLKKDRDVLLGQKRELEFEIIMYDEQKVRQNQKDEKKLEAMQHKIETLKLNQQKINKQSKWPSQLRHSPSSSYFFIGGANVWCAAFCASSSGNLQGARHQGPGP